MFAVSRFAHYLKCMVRDKIGSTKEKDQLERWLNNWIVRYVDADPTNSSEELKARKPLAAAKITVIPNEENPGQYNANVYLRPHFQLEGMDIGMSLVASLPESRG
jgi:type VI secretion system protein ImpC